MAPAPLRDAGSLVRAHQRVTADAERLALSRDRLAERIRAEIAGGASLGDIASALGMSKQRVHDIASGRKRARKAVAAGT